MNQRRASFLDNFCACRFTRLFRWLAKDNMRTITFDCANLHLCRVRWHDDVRRNAPQFRRARYCGPVIARRMRRHTTLRCRVVQGEDCVGGAACLKRTNLLKILALKKQRRPTRLIQPLTRQYRRAMNIRLNALVRRANAGEIERHGKFYVCDSESKIAK